MTNHFLSCSNRFMCVDCGAGRIVRFYTADCTHDMVLCMPRIRRTQIVLALAAAFSAQMSYADDNPTPVTTPDPVPGQAHITADSLSGEMNTDLKARGNVVVTRDDQRLASDWLDYYQAKNRIKAGDHFVLTRAHDRVEGTQLDYNLDSRTGTGQQPSFQSGPIVGHAKPGELPPVANQIRGTGSVVEFRGKDNYRILKSSATSCSVGDDSWYLNSSRLDLDYTNGVGNAYNARLIFEGVPILYSPWLDFSLDGKRKSGFLYPTLKGGTTGTELAVPFYWNLAPNYDATLTPHINLRHGEMLGIETRLLEPDYNGWIYTEQLPRDQATNTYRYLWSGAANATLAPGLTVGADGTHVSDDNYFSDFGDRYTVASNVNLVSEAWADYSFAWTGGSANAHLLEQRYQTLQTTGSYVTPPYARLPDLSFTVNQALPYGLATNLTTDLTQFSSPVAQDGSRFIAYPSITMPFDRGWGYIHPKIGVNYTSYQLDTFGGDPAHDITRTVPIASIDSGLYFDRPTSMLGGNQTQTLEPRLYYLHVPAVDQSNIPNFDTSQNDFGFAQIFSENTYSGGDRIDAANQLTGALTTRLIDNDSGREIIRAAVGQRFYFTQQYIDLNGNIQTRSNNSSDFLGSLGGEVVKNWNLDSLYEFNSETHQTDQYNISLSYQPEPGKVASIRYRYDTNAALNAAGNPENLHTLDIGLQWPIAPKWYGLVRGDYSLQDRQLLDQLVGVEYNAGCWVLRLVTERYITNLTQNQSAIYFQVELKGLGSIGNSPLDSLNMAIPGYTKTEDLQP